MAVSDAEAPKIAKKLHRQFGHPNPEKIIMLLHKAGVKNKLLDSEVKSVSSNCDTCKRYKKPMPRPVVALPIAEKFNDVLAMDLKSYGEVYFLVMVDHATRFCAAEVICNKKPSTIARCLILKWISVFGPPSIFFADNGGEFQNQEMYQLAETFNIRVMTTAAESPWSNGIVEKMNGVLANSVARIVDDTKCDVSTALAWAVSARNSLYNYAGFSPYQLVFGFNISFPNNLQNKPPALEQISNSEIVRKNLNALHAARKHFLTVESSEKLQRALRHNVRESEIQDVQQGDIVYYKRNDGNEWKGPGTVIGRDGKQVLVKHGSNYVRVHVCRLASSTRQDSAEQHRSLQDKKQVMTKIRVEEEVSSDDDDSSPVTKLSSSTGNGEIASNCDEGVESHDTSSVATAAPSQEIYYYKKARRGDRIEGISKDTGEVIIGKLSSRAGKVGSKHEHCWNIEKSDGSISWYDLKTGFQELSKLQDDVELFVFYNTEDVSNAKIKEIENWRANEVYSEVDDAGQNAISTRWVVTEKIKEGKTVTKARLVARGFEEETSQLQKDSPTCLKESVKLALAIASTKGWEVKSLDVKSAYLQGNPISRELYLRPPPEFYQGTLWKLNKTVYGLCDAARSWYLRVKDQLLSMGLKMCSYDNAIFSYSCQGIFQGLICVYVDDFLYCGSTSFQENIVSKIYSSFQIGSSEAGIFRYLGINISAASNHMRSIDQFNYALSLKPMNISKARLNNKYSELTEKERSEFRSIVGQLHWIATQTRPDIAFDACELSGSTSKAVISDVHRLNKVVNKVATDSYKIVFPKMNDISDCYLECFSDSSFANLADGGSQGGYIIFLVDSDGHRCPIFWQSRKIRRVVKSTLAAETLALLDGAEAAYFIVNIISEILLIPHLQIHCNVDNKSLLEALYTSKLVDDRRLRIDIAVLQDMLNRKEITKVHWVDTAGQLADCLTKKGAPPGRLKGAISH